MKDLNLATDPWIKVFTNDSETKTVSMIDFFENAQNYHGLAGEMSAQDAITLRFLLAVLTTVYSRVNTKGTSYSWIHLDDKFQVEKVEKSDSMAEDLLSTWKDLFSAGRFSKAVTNYLVANKEKFEFNRLYQVDEETFNKLAKKKISAGKATSTVEVKQINRTISESNHSPVIFSPKTNSNKNKLEIDELVRWVIMYQNIAGVTDKNKVASTSKSAGWYYKLNPVFIQQNNLFKTLMLNLVLENYEDGYRIERPVWEFENTKKYVEFLVSNPDITKQSRSMIYTLGARMLHINWDKENPIIFVAGLPQFENVNAFNDPMAIFVKKDDKDEVSIPVPLKDVERDLWLDLDKIIYKSDHKPGVIEWLRKLALAGAIDPSTKITLRRIDLISNGMLTSQLPEVQYDKIINFTVKDIVNSDSVKKIREVAETSRALANLYWRFTKDIVDLRGLSNGSLIATRQKYDFAHRLSAVFNLWVRSDESLTVNMWKNQVRPVFEEEGEKLLEQASPRDIKGKKNEDGEIVNIFTFYNRYKGIGLSCLKIEK